MKKAFNVLAVALFTVISVTTANAQEHKRVVVVKHPPVHHRVIVHRKPVMHRKPVVVMHRKPVVVEHH